MNVFNFFKGLGKVLIRTFSIIRKIAGDDQIKLAIEIVKKMAVSGLDNNERRERAVTMLMDKGFSESIARWLVETAVQHIKADVIDKNAGKLENLLDGDDK